LRLLDGLVPRHPAEDGDPHATDEHEHDETEDGGEQHGSRDGSFPVGRHGQGIGTSRMKGEVGPQACRARRWSVRERTPRALIARSAELPCKMRAFDMR
jgi:hypothetical protein